MRGRFWSCHYNHCVNYSPMCFIGSIIKMSTYSICCAMCCHESVCICVESWPCPYMCHTRVFSTYITCSRHFHLSLAFHKAPIPGDHDRLKMSSVMFSFIGLPMNLLFFFLIVLYILKHTHLIVDDNP